MHVPRSQALETLARDGCRLRTQWHFDWPEVVQQTVHRVRWDESVPQSPLMAALIGGASSGKSTVFNNLLGGRSVSRIAAKGHTTLGPIAAVHERHRDNLEHWLHEGLAFPGFLPEFIDLDADGAGSPDGWRVAYHHDDALADVWLFDLPDFTSRRAEQEGDVALSLLPWFDQLIVLIDHERWFDRQSISPLREASSRLAQERFVLFNRTIEGELSEADRRRLAEQADRLRAAAFSILDFRRGRGLVRFAPGTLDPVLAFFARERPSRRKALYRRLAEAANAVLNQNEERKARLKQLGESVRHAATRTVPDARSCLHAIMTAEERRQVEPFSRILRLGDTRAWLSRQTDRLTETLGRIPLMGAVFPRNERAADSDGKVVDRGALVAAFVESVLRRQTYEINRIVQGSAFWDELRRWTGLFPLPRTWPGTAPLRSEVQVVTADIDRALAAWLAKVDAECRGLSPHVRGAIGVGGVALAIALIAAPGPVAALTLVTAKTAVGAALGELLTATGAGALLAKPMGRALALMEENLLGTAEHRTVQKAASQLRSLLQRHAEALRAAVLAEAEAFVLSRDNSLGSALETLREERDDST